MRAAPDFFFKTRGGNSTQPNLLQRVALAAPRRTVPPDGAERPDVAPRPLALALGLAALGRLAGELPAQGPELAGALDAPGDDLTRERDPERCEARLPEHLLEVLEVAPVHVELDERPEHLHDLVLVALLHRRREAQQQVAQLLGDRARLLRAVLGLGDPSVRDHLQRVLSCLCALVLGGEGPLGDDGRLGARDGEGGIVRGHDDPFCYRSG